MYIAISVSESVQVEERTSSMIVSGTRAPMCKQSSEGLNRRYGACVGRGDGFSGCATWAVARSTRLCFMTVSSGIIHGVEG